MSYLIQLSTSAKKLHHHVTLTNECRTDLIMWHNFLSHWNGISVFLDSGVTSTADMDLYTDASSIGFGGYFQGQWFSERWPEDLPTLSNQELSMAYKELYPIVVSAIAWGPSWSTKRLCFMCDNMATKCIVNKGRSKCVYIMSLMRRLTWCAIQYNFCFSATYLPSLDNSIADSLSRLQMVRFRGLAPTAATTPVICPPFCKVIWSSAMLLQS